MVLPASTIVRGPQNTGDTSLASGTALSTMVIRKFSGYQKILSPTETPFSSSAKDGESVNQKKVEWLSRFLAAHQVTLGVAVADGTTETITLAAGEGVKVMPTDLVKLESEVMWVRAVNGNQLTVTRAMGGTSGAAHTLLDGAGVARILQIIGVAAQESADTPISPIAKGALEYNYPQLFDYGVHVSEREDSTPDYEFQSGSKYDAYLEQIMKDAAIDFEIASLLGQRGTESAMTVGAGTPTLMGGLDFFTDTEVNLAGAAITENTLMTALQDKWVAVGPSNTPTTLLVGPFMKRALSSLWNSNRYATVNDEVTTLQWTKVMTDFGDIKFTLSRYIPAGSAYLVNMKDISKHPYGRHGSWRDVKLPANGPYLKGRFTGDYTMVFLNNATRTKITNASTTVSDYPNM